MNGAASRTPRLKRPGILIGLGVGLVVIPAVLGIALLADDAGTDTTSTDGMGGGNAMSDDALANSGVFDFNEILDGSINLEVGPDARSATVRLNTTIDLVCAVAYGPTNGLGALATDTDMAGGGHRDHSPILVGLEPDSDYFYRLQGVAADGRLFVSDLMTFTTGAGSDATTPAPNIAGGASVVDVSSEFSGAFAAANAVDGDLATEWSSAGDGNDAFITIDLQFPADVVGVGFRTREMSDGTSITNSFTVTVDGEETFGPFQAGPGLAVIPVSFFGQIIRFDVESSTGGNTGAVEIEVYGSFPPDGSDM